MTTLKPGDILSFSSGFQQRGPQGFRVLRQEKGGGLLGLMQQRWPQLLGPFAGKTPMIINGYPACIGRFDFGVLVDSYLSGSVVSRSLMLAQLEKLPVMFVGQPLFVADALIRHMARGLPLPEDLLLGVGGYVLPRSLEAALRELITPHVRSFNVFQGYGVAEVDAGVLIGVDRTEKGEVIYYRRDDNVWVELQGDRLYLWLRDAVTGEWIIQRWETGDYARPEGDGFVLWPPEGRLSPAVLKILDGWTTEDWKRRTGYLNVGTATRVQLRRNIEKQSPQELDHWDYGKQFGFSWLWKPNWSKGPDLRATVATLGNPAVPKK